MLIIIIIIVINTFLLRSGGGEGDLNAEIKRKVRSKYHAITILQTEADSKCRLSNKFDETTNQITSACPLLVKVQYVVHSSSKFS